MIAGQLSIWESRALDHFDFVIGIDEAGRGPIFGPVTCGAFCWVKPETIAQHAWAQLVADSKEIKEAVRDEIYAQISGETEPAGGNFQWAVVEGTVEEIDNGDILAVTLKCMTAACLKLMANLTAQGLATETTTFKVLIDGNKIPAQLRDCNNVHVESIVKGDSKVFTISCASIVAKCHRDALIRELALQYPAYALEVHKGYLTQRHRTALLEHGPCPLHRLTFEPCKTLLLKGSFPVPAGRSLDCVTRKVELKKAARVRPRPRGRRLREAGQMPLVLVKTMKTSPKKHLVVS